jgi:hypothetical protein
VINAREVSDKDVKSKRERCEKHLNSMLYHLNENLEESEKEEEELEAV